VEELVPDVGDAGEAPVDAVGVAAGVASLLVGDGVPVPAVHRRVRVLAGIRQLRHRVRRLVVHPPAGEEVALLVA
uniref:Uncharacterized protein n=1 Tax=Oryza brachyantha TaxID=4533 RepID=J3LU51_ORYBR